MKICFLPIDNRPVCYNLAKDILAIDKNIKLHRTWFKQMCSLIGINVDYYVPLDKEYSEYGELHPDYRGRPMVVGCIYDEHPTQKTMRKLGWNAELADTSVVIHVPYDLKGLQAGCRFDLPAGIDGAPPRQFKVLRLSSKCCLRARSSFDQRVC